MERKYDAKCAGNMMTTHAHIVKAHMVIDTIAESSR